MDKPRTDAHQTAATVDPTGAEVAKEFADLEAEAFGESPPGGQVPLSAPPPPPPPASEVYRELLEPLLYMGFQVLAPNWEISKVEAETLADNYAPLLAKYFPETPDKFGPEITAAFCTVAILGPRLRKPRKLNGPEQPEAGEISQAPPGAPERAPGDDPQVTAPVPE